jgi:hypothetical protein
MRVARVKFLNTLLVSKTNKQGVFPSNASEILGEINLRQSASPKKFRECIGDAKESGACYASRPPPHAYKTTISMHVIPHMYGKPPFSIHNFQTPMLKPLQDLIPSRFETVPILKHLSSASRALAELKGVVASIPNERILINILGIQEAKDSSEIENIVTTHDVLTAAENCRKKWAHSSSCVTGSSVDDVVNDRVAGALGTTRGGAEGQQRTCGTVANVHRWKLTSRSSARTCLSLSTKRWPAVRCGLRIAPTDSDSLRMASPLAVWLGLRLWRLLIRPRQNPPRTQS